MSINFAALLPFLLSTFREIGKVLLAAGVDIKAEMADMLQEVEDTREAEKTAEASEEADYEKRPLAERDTQP